MRSRFVLPCVVVASVGLGGCGGGSSSSAVAQSSAVRASALAAVAAGNHSTAAAAKGVSQSSASRSSAAVKPAAPALVDAQGNPIIPVAARAHTDAGAIAFTKYYWALLADFDAHPRDPNALRSLAASDCDEVCQKEHEAIKQLVQTGTKFEGVTQNLSKFQTVPGGEGKRTVVFLLEQRGGRRIAKDKSINLGNYRLDMNAVVRWQGDGWKIVAVRASAR